VAIRNIGADADFSLTVKMLPAIAFCPVADVVDAFETLAEDIGVMITRAFEDTYIDRPGRHQRRDPRFSHDMWNVYQRTLQELPRTNNNIEEWHRGFQSLIGSCHPNTWTFLGKLIRQQSLHHIQLTQILAGDVIPQRKKYQDAAIVYFTYFRTMVTVMCWTFFVVLLTIFTCKDFGQYTLLLDNNCSAL
jgi:hypothetical protein